MTVSSNCIMQIMYRVRKIGLRAMTEALCYTVYRQWETRVGVGRKILEEIRSVLLRSCNVNKT